MIKTVSLETAKALKEAGFSKETSFYWVNWGKVQAWQCRHKEYIDKYWDEVVEKGYTTISAPCSDELLSDFPASIQGNEFFVDRFHDKWFFGYYELYHDDKPYLDSPVEALASLWLWLKKQNLLTLTHPAESE